MISSIGSSKRCGILGGRRAERKTGALPIFIWDREGERHFGGCLFYLAVLWIELLMEKVELKQIM